jgi:hypothetical protein
VDRPRDLSPADVNELATFLAALPLVRTPADVDAVPPEAPGVRAEALTDDLLAHLAARTPGIRYLASDGNTRVTDERAPESVVAQVGAALQLISEAKQGFGELVADHLRQVIVATGVRVLSVNPPAYWESFDWEDTVDPHQVACLLVWAATAIRLYRDARRSRRRLADSQVENACWEAQQRFLKQLPDGDWWIDRMRPRGSAA